MKIYIKGKDFATYQVDETWVETEDEIVDTPIGQQLKSYILTAEYQQKVMQYQKSRQIAQLKKNLADTDCQAIKKSEGLFTEEEYAPIKAQRQAWRDEINELEEQV